MRSLGPAKVDGAPWALGQGAEPGIHDHCFACGHSVEGLRLRFTQVDEDTVSAEWYCNEIFQSYPDIIHGGIIATLLDSAMTNCLLAKGIEALTAELTVRYHSSLCVGKDAVVTARVLRSRSAFYLLEAEVRQDDVTIATAQGKFMKRKSGGGANI